MEDTIMINNEEKDMAGNYDAWLLWDLTIKCNLKCSYCSALLNRRKSPKIDTASFMRMLENTGKIFRIDFVGGEPFMAPNFIEICAGITLKHYICFHTNL